MAEQVKLSSEKFRREMQKLCEGQDIGIVISTTCAILGGIVAATIKNAPQIEKEVKSDISDRLAKYSIIDSNLFIVPEITH